MTLISSISGIRGTVGGKPGEGLTPADLVRFATAYGMWLRERFPGKRLKVVVGRDARVSGEMVCGLVCNTLNALGLDTLELGMAPTPTVEMAVVMEQADGGIIITASHNPAEWNALKLLNEKGEFLNAAEGEEVMRLAREGEPHYAGIDGIGIRMAESDYHRRHIERILELPLVRREKIARADLRVVVDGVNSVGGFAVPSLLRALGVKTIIEVNCEPNGLFAHDPEPLEKNLTGTAARVREEKADLGIVVDPDVDRLAFINEDGTMFGEEYTLVAVADYVLASQPGDTVSNLSSTAVLDEVTRKYGGKRHLAAVGEVNVVEKMKATGAVIGGEGNGGVIYPPLHYGRDALVGIALFLSFLAEEGESVSKLRARYPTYAMSKDKVPIPPSADPEQLFERLRQRYNDRPMNTIDGLFIELPDGWIHFRRSNTEPVFRLYIEMRTESRLKEVREELLQFVGSMKD